MKDILVSGVTDVCLHKGLLGWHPSVLKQWLPFIEISHLTHSPDILVSSTNELMHRIRCVCLKGIF